MTVNEIIKELKSIVEENPEKGNVEIFIFIQDINKLVDNGESPQPILLVDKNISDRVDLNI